MDIRFYDFDFNLLYIMPPFSKTIGYSSFNAKKEFNGPGSFEIVFLDDELKKLIEKNRDGLFVQCGKFQGYVTGYQWESNNCSIFGKHLNGLLSWRVVRSNTLTNHTVAEAFIELITNSYSEIFQYVTADNEFTGINTYTNDKYEQGDKVIEAFCKSYGAGYEIAADFKEKTLAIALKKPKEKILMLSENNLNAYDIVVSYDNKERITGGYYTEKYTATENVNNAIVEVERVRYPYIGSENATGLKRRDIFFKAENESDAKVELTNKKVFNQYTFETKNIEYGVDYELGDIVRIQTGTETVKRKVTAVNLWNEKEYGEKPILSEVEE